MQSFQLQPIHVIQSVIDLALMGVELVPLPNFDILHR